MSKLYILCVLLIAPTFITSQGIYSRFNSRQETAEKKEERRRNYSAKGPRRIGPNGEILSEYDEELQRQQDLAEAQNILQQLRQEQQQFFDDRRSEFENVLNRAEESRRESFERNQSSKF